MWEVTNRTPFAAAGYFLRDTEGTEFWVVAAAALFDIRSDGLLAIAEEQPAPLLAPLYRDKEARELWLDADLAPFRPLPDILVSGAACRPDMAPFARHEAAIRVGALGKRGVFFGERVLRRVKGRAVIEPGEDTAEVPLTWTLALGGPDPFDATAEPNPFNPIGMGWTERWPDLPAGAELALPRIENPAAPIDPGKPLPAPHGFGALQPAWRPRRDHAGTYDAAWRDSRAPLPPLDFSLAFHQAAPSDQIYPDPAPGGAPVSVDGFHPGGPYGFRLPQMILDARTTIGWDKIDTRLRLVGIAIEASRKRLRLAYNASVDCHGRDQDVRGSLLTLRQIAGVAR